MTQKKKPVKRTLPQMKQIRKRIFANIVIFFIGAILYFAIECAFKGHLSHWSMAILGGTAMLVCSWCNNLFSFDMPLLAQMTVCSGVITLLEFVAGLVLNIWLGLGIWNYSNLHFQFMGQISLLFSGVWFLLSLVGIVISDYIEYSWFGIEPRPYYKVFGFVIQII